MEKFTGFTKFSLSFNKFRKNFFSKVAGSRPDEVNDFLSIYIILPVAPGPGINSASSRNEYQKHKK
jgi:hypothetical protein